MPVAVLGRLGPELATDVAGGFLDLGQEGLDPWPEGLHLPRHPRAGPAPGSDRSSGGHRPHPDYAPDRVEVEVVEPPAGAVVVVVVGVGRATPDVAW